MSRMQDLVVDEESDDDEELTTIQDTQGAIQQALFDSQAMQGTEAVSFSSNLDL
jgi:hypothetical protein